MASSQAGECEKFSSNTYNTFPTCEPISASWLRTRAAKTIFRDAPGLGAQIGQTVSQVVPEYFARFVEELKLFQKSSLNWMKETNQNNLCRVEAVDLRERKENSDLFRNMPS
jgi:hypothetical protein